MLGSPAHCFAGPPPGSVPVSWHSVCGLSSHSCVFANSCARAAKEPVPALKLLTLVRSVVSSKPFTTSLVSRYCSPSALKYLNDISRHLKLISFCNKKKYIYIFSVL